MRNRYIVTYDISDARRLRLVFKTMRGYGEHLQFSVFECELSKKELVIMQGALKEIIKHDDDQVIIVDIGPAEGRGSTCVSSLGKPYSPVERTAVVV